MTSDSRSKPDRAETTEIGSVHESGGAEGNRPNTRATPSLEAGELLPCQFPHEVERGVDFEVDRDDFGFVRGICCDCGAAGPYVNIDIAPSAEDLEKAKAEAAKLWNTRIQSSPTPSGEAGELILDDVTDDMLNAGQSRLCEISNDTSFDDYEQAEIFIAMLKAAPPELLQSSPTRPIDVERRARELLAEAMGVEVESDGEIDLEDKDQCFIEDALRAIERALFIPTPSVSADVVEAGKSGEVPTGKCWKCSRCGWVGCFSAEDLAQYGELTECQENYHEDLYEIDLAEGWAALSDEADLEVRRAERALEDAKQAATHAHRNAAALTSKDNSNEAG